MAAPDRIGRYLILGELGRGAMGTVYAGRDERLDREVAVKVMSRGLADPEARRRFLREARAAARLQHPNIVVVYELGEHEGAPFMALERLDGIDLQRAIDAGIRPDPRTTLPIVLQLLAGLGHAHERGIVHRDVKPSNVFLPFGRPAKIMDFGVARLAGPGTTTSGAVVGTPNYMSPEQVAEGPVDGRSDLFSAGLILYELVTGERAFRADSVVSILYKIRHESPDLSLLPEEEGWRRLRGVLARALAREAEERFPDAQTMSAELARALVDLGGKADPSAPSDQALLARPRPTGPAPPTSAAPGAVTAVAVVEAPGPGTPGAATASSRSRSARRLAVGALLLLAAAGGWLWRQRGGEPGPSAPPTPAPPAPSRAPASAGGPTAAAATPAPPASAAPTRSPEPVAPSPSPTPTAPPPAPTAEPVLGVEARLLRAEDALARGRWADALADARAVLDVRPTNPRAASLAQQAEAELVIEECVRNARAALQAGDAEHAREEVLRGLAVRKNDPRLLEVFREIVRQ